MNKLQGMYPNDWTHLDKLLLQLAIQNPDVCLPIQYTKLSYQVFSTQFRSRWNIRPNKALSSGNNCPYCQSEKNEIFLILTLG